MDKGLSRKQFLVAALTSGAASLLPSEVHAAAVKLELKASQNPADLTLADIQAFEKAIGFELSETERKAALVQIKDFKSGYEKVRSWNLDNSVAPALSFLPQGRQPKPGLRTDVRTSKPNAKIPTDESDIAFACLNDLSHWVKSKQISPVELTNLYLARLEKYGGSLLNVVTLTADRAIAAAREAETEVVRGRYRGWLHGIPYVIKDLFAAKGYPTTWGAEPFKNQTFAADSAVVERLEQAGAILCAKTSVGALAMDDHWFKGKTKNPWNPAQGSSGSSAGSASCMAAGLAGFTIGTETLGSIMSPSHRCRTTGLRPTFGRISRYGAMALSWTMDKVGPICRTAQDAALVLAALHGSDPRDTGSVDRPFRFRPDFDLKRMKIGYLSDDKALDDDDSGGGPDDAIQLLRKLGADPKPIKFTQPGDGIDTLLSVEAAAAFEAITRNRSVDDIKNSLWPAIFKNHQFTTGVGYLQAMRARTLLMERFEKELGEYDAVIASDRGSYLLYITNLTGHPQLYIPWGLDKNKVARGISIIGRLYDEGTILSIGAQLQQSTGFWKDRPDLSKLA